MNEPTDIFAYIEQHFNHDITSQVNETNDLKGQDWIITTISSLKGAKYMVGFAADSQNWTSKISSYSDSEPVPSTLIPFI